MGSERSHVDKYLCTVCGHRHSNGWYCKHSIDAKDAEIERLKETYAHECAKVSQRDREIEELKAQLSASEEKRKVLANEALRKREQAAASERLQEFDQHASHAEKEGGLRAILLAEWVEARNAHAEAIKATDAAKALEG